MKVHPERPRAFRAIDRVPFKHWHAVIGFITGSAASRRASACSAQQERGRHRRGGKRGRAAEALRPGRIAHASLKGRYLVVGNRYRRTLVWLDPQI